MHARNSLKVIGGQELFMSREGTLEQALSPDHVTCPKFDHSELPQCCCGHLVGVAVYFATQRKGFAERLTRFFPTAHFTVGLAKIVKCCGEETPI